MRLKKNTPLKELRVRISLHIKQRERISAERIASIEGFNCEHVVMYMLFGVER